jgi:hypothetical protein
MSVHLQQPKYHLWACLGPKTADVCAVAVMLHQRLA